MMRESRSYVELMPERHLPDYHGVEKPKWQSTWEVAVSGKTQL
jgi:hypothetical protein